MKQQFSGNEKYKELARVFYETQEKINKILKEEFEYEITLAPNNYNASKNSVYLKFLSIKGKDYLSFWVDENGIIKQRQSNRTNSELGTKIYRAIEDEIRILYIRLRRYRFFLTTLEMDIKCTVKDLEVSITSTDVFILVPKMDDIIMFNYPYYLLGKEDSKELLFEHETEVERFVQSNISEIFKRIYILKNDCPGWVKQTEDSNSVRKFLDNCMFDSKLDKLYS